MYLIGSCRKKQQGSMLNTPSCDTIPSDPWQVSQGASQGVAADVWKSPAHINFNSTLVEPIFLVVDHHGTWGTWGKPK
jgi:hypothetical protein